MSADTTLAVLRIAGSFAAVAVLLWLFARLSRTRFGSSLGGHRRHDSAEPLAVLARQQLTRSSSLAIVRAGRRHLLVGCGESGLHLLADGDDLVLDDGEPAAIDLDRTAAAAATAVPAPTNHRRARTGDARTRPPRTDRSTPPRRSFVDALRDKTVRR